jgi:hypothetical protein
MSASLALCGHAIPQDIIHIFGLQLHSGVGLITNAAHVCHAHMLNLCRHTNSHSFLGATLIVCQGVRACMQFTDHIVRLAKAACQQLTLAEHQATHPRLGVVDHISCHALEPDGKAPAAAMATAVAAALAAAEPALPVVMYGDASGTKSRLQDVRRACGAPVNVCSRASYFFRSDVHCQSALVSASAISKFADACFSDANAVN